MSIQYPGATGWSLIAFLLHRGLSSGKAAGLQRKSNPVRSADRFRFEQIG